MLIQKNYGNYSLPRLSYFIIVLNTILGLRKEVLIVVWKIDLKRKINTVRKYLPCEMPINWQGFAAEMQFQTLQNTEIIEEKLLMSL